MKTNKYVLLTFLGISALFTSCDNFLETSPRDFQSEKIFFKSKADFVAAANALHTNVYAWNQGNDSYPILFDSSSDLSTDNNGGYGNGTNVPGTSDKYWEQTYKWLRQVNQVIAKGEEYANKEEIAGPIGQAYFYRAWHHLFLLERFGGVPIETYVPDVQSNVVWGKRNSRYEVIGQILSDLDTAIAKLQASNTTVTSTNNDGHVTLEAAQALKARVCLFEGTWDKYVGETTDGDGMKEGAGKVKPVDYPSVEQFLTMAKDLSHKVMTNPSFSLWKGVETVSSNIVDGEALYGHTSYYYYFNLEDAASNPNGLTKESDHESIFRSVFDFVNRPGNMNISHASPIGPTRKMMDMFLCKDGLPPFLSQYKPDYTKMTSEFEHRDYRLTSWVKRPYKYYWSFGTKGGCPSYTTDLTSYPKTDANYFYVPMLRGNGAVGYGGRKYTTEQAARETYKESADFKHIRLAEMYLIYAEATCELNNGEISDDDLNISINKLRERAGVAPLTHALIAPHPELTLLGEIRRERALELFGEGRRLTDLYRWGIAEEEMTGYPVCGVYLSYNGQPTEYVSAINPADELPIYTPSAYENMITTQDYTVSSYTGIPKMKAGAVIATQVANRQFKLKDYLQPIPTTQIKLNSQLLQNPGW